MAWLERQEPLPCAQGLVGASRLGGAGGLLLEGEDLTPCGVGALHHLPSKSGWPILPTKRPEAAPPRMELTSSRVDHIPEGTMNLKIFTAAILAGISVAASAAPAGTRV